MVFAPIDPEKTERALSDEVKGHIMRLFPQERYNVNDLPEAFIPQLSGGVGHLEMFNTTHSYALNVKETLLTLIANPIGRHWYITNSVFVAITISNG